MLPDDSNRRRGVRVNLNSRERQTTRLRSLAASFAVVVFIPALRAE